MGVSIGFVEESFFMRKEHFKKAVDAANNSGLWSYDPENINDVFDECGFEPVYDSKNNITGLDWTGNNYKYDVNTVKMFTFLARFVHIGSYIHMYDEDGDHFRWYFDGEMCHEQYCIGYIFDKNW